MSLALKDTLGVYWADKVGKGITVFPRSIIGSLYYHAERDKHAFCLLGKYKREGGGK